MKQLSIGLLLAGVALLLAHLHSVSQTYHPVVKVDAPGGISYTALLQATRERPACSAAHRRFLAPLEAQCAQCEVTAARCERELHGLELELQRGAPVPYYVVAMSEVRIAIEGSDAAARQACDLIAGEIARRGGRRARCASPRAAG